MSEIQMIHTSKAPAAVGPYSQGTAWNALVFVSGQLGLLPESGTFAGGPEDFESQARQALRNMSAILDAAGSSLEQVLNVEVFLTDMGQFATFNAIYEEFFNTHKPARAAVEVAGLPKGGLVEVKCTATKS
ncbi:endoribonuclease L-PSP [Paucidesulfovibrio gracilis DSM 16080]|uniref:Endoribonuclease L-PSP n=1 Tax=Paucidesulfovibrio gracilis DSM 16080 TaxID=1121449 RepID=A0A1T4X429_9BACT|nr:Rid family detoxifying hydrolase [Paucidesulfovibrio gracilis]SKA84187.1 endoribonuclease L-PSP [Paucidesulfovibrio gracilis DSM 16080]